MCTYEEVKGAVHEVLTEEDEKGFTYIGRQVNKHIDRRSNQIVSQLTFRFAVALLLLSFSLGGVYFSINYRLADVENDILKGERWTYEDHLQYSSEIDRRFLELNKDIDEMKGDVKDIRKAVIGY